MGGGQSKPAHLKSNVADAEHEPLESLESTFVVALQWFGVLRKKKSEIKILLQQLKSHNAPDFNHVTKGGRVGTGCGIAAKIRKKNGDEQARWNTLCECACVCGI